MQIGHLSLVMKLDVIHMIEVIHDLLNSPGGGFCIEQKEKLITAAQERNPSLL